MSVAFIMSARINRLGGRGAARPQRVQHEVGAQGADAGHGGRGGGRGSRGGDRILRCQRRLATRPEAGAPARAAWGIQEQPPRHLLIFQGFAAYAFSDANLCCAILGFGFVRCFAHVSVLVSSLAGEMAVHRYHSHHSPTDLRISKNQVKR
jgi:hypothetical protein